MIGAAIHNAKIKETMLGIEDHGILTFSLTLEFDGSTCGYGGYAFDHRDRFQEGKVVPNGGGVGLTMIRAVLETVGVRSWEKLNGELVRVEVNDVRVLRLGNILEERWVDLDTLSRAAREPA